MSGYALFVREVARRQLHVERPDDVITQRDAFDFAAELWKNLSDVEQQEWKTRAKQIRFDKFGGGGNCNPRDTPTTQHRNAAPTRDDDDFEEEVDKTGVEEGGGGKNSGTLRKRVMKRMHKFRKDQLDQLFTSGDGRRRQKHMEGDIDDMTQEESVSEEETTSDSCTNSRRTSTQHGSQRSSVAYFTTGGKQRRKPTAFVERANEMNGLHERATLSVMEARRAGDRDDLMMALGWQQTDGDDNGSNIIHHCQHMQIALVMTNPRPPPVVDLEDVAPTTPLIDDELCVCRVALSQLMPPTSTAADTTVKCAPRKLRNYRIEGAACNTTADAEHVTRGIQRALSHTLCMASSRVLFTPTDQYDASVTVLRRASCAQLWQNTRIVCVEDLLLCLLASGRHQMSSAYLGDAVHQSCRPPVVNAQQKVVPPVMKHACSVHRVPSADKYGQLCAKALTYYLIKSMGALLRVELRLAIVASVAAGDAPGQSPPPNYSIPPPPTCLDADVESGGVQAAMAWRHEADVKKEKQLMQTRPPMPLSLINMRPLVVKRPLHILSIVHPDDYKEKRSALDENKDSPLGSYRRHGKDESEVTTVTEEDKSSSETTTNTQLSDGTSTSTSVARIQTGMYDMSLK